MYNQEWNQPFYGGPQNIQNNPQGPNYYQPQHSSGVWPPPPPNSAPPPPPDSEKHLPPEPPIQPPNDQMPPPLPTEPPPSDDAKVEQMNWQMYMESIAKYQEDLRLWQHQQDVLLEQVNNEELEFDTQYVQWIKQYNDWKEQNKNHPNKEQYQTYEIQWKQYENQMHDKKQMLKQRKDQLLQAKYYSLGQSMPKIPVPPPPQPTDYISRNMPPPPPINYNPNTMPNFPSQQQLPLNNMTLQNNQNNPPFHDAPWNSSNNQAEKLDGNNQNNVLPGPNSQGSNIQNTFVHRESQPSNFPNDNSNLRFSQQSQQLQQFNRPQFEGMHGCNRMQHLSESQQYGNHFGDQSKQYDSPMRQSIPARFAGDFHSAQGDQKKVINIPQNMLNQGNSRFPIDNQQGSNFHQFDASQESQCNKDFGHNFLQRKPNDNFTETGQIPRFPHDNQNRMPLDFGNSFPNQQPNRFPNQFYSRPPHGEHFTGIRFPMDNFQAEKNERFTNPDMVNKFPQIDRNSTQETVYNILNKISSDIRFPSLNQSPLDTQINSFQAERNENFNNDISFEQGNRLPLPKEIRFNNRFGTNEMPNRIINNMGNKFTQPNQVNRFLQHESITNLPTEVVNRMPPDFDNIFKPPNQNLRFQSELRNKFPNEMQNKMPTDLDNRMISNSNFDPKNQNQFSPNFTNRFPPNQNYNNNESLHGLRPLTNNQFHHGMNDSQFGNETNKFVDNQPGNFFRKDEIDDGKTKIQNDKFDNFKDQFAGEDVKNFIEEVNRFDAGYNEDFTPNSKDKEMQPNYNNANIRMNETFMGNRLPSESINRFSSQSVNKLPIQNINHPLIRADNNENIHARFPHGYNPNLQNQESNKIANQFGNRIVTPQGNRYTSMPTMLCPIKSETKTPENKESEKLKVKNEIGMKHDTNASIIMAKTNINKFLIQQSNRFPNFSNVQTNQTDDLNNSILNLRNQLVRPGQVKLSNDPSNIAQNDNKDINKFIINTTNIKLLNKGILPHSDIAKKKDDKDKSISAKVIEVGSQNKNTEVKPFSEHRNIFPHSDKPINFKSDAINQIEKDDKTEDDGSLKIESSSEQNVNKQMNLNEKVVNSSPQKQSHFEKPSRFPLNESQINMNTTFLNANVRQRFQSNVSSNYLSNNPQNDNMRGFKRQAYRPQTRQQIDPFAKFNTNLLCLNKPNTFQLMSKQNKIMASEENLKEREQSGSFQESKKISDEETCGNNHNIGEQFSEETEAKRFCQETGNRFGNTNFHDSFDGPNAKNMKQFHSHDFGQKLNQPSFKSSVNQFKKPMSLMDITIDMNLLNPNLLNKNIFHDEEDVDYRDQNVENFEQNYSTDNQHRYNANTSETIIQVPKFSERDLDLIKMAAEELKQLQANKFSSDDLPTEDVDFREAHHQIDNHKFTEDQNLSNNNFNFEKNVHRSDNNQAGSDIIETGGQKLPQRGAALFPIKKPTDFNADIGRGQNRFNTPNRYNNNGNRDQILSRSGDNSRPRFQPDGASNERFLRGANSFRGRGNFQNNFAGPRFNERGFRPGLMPTPTGQNFRGSGFHSSRGDSIVIDYDHAGMGDEGVDTDWRQRWKRPDEQGQTSNTNKSFKLKKEKVLVEKILKPAQNSDRPERIVVILRGLPGSGKSHIAKLIKEKEIENGRQAPRLLCLDDYFMTEAEKITTDPETGKKFKKMTLVYEYDPSLEPSYKASFLRSFKRQIDDSFFTFIIVDAIFSDVKFLEDFCTYAGGKAFQVYIVELEVDVETCAERNEHNRTLEDIKKMKNSWRAVPFPHIQLDVTSLLREVAITEVEMEDIQIESSNAPNDDEDESDNNANAYKSKWEIVDTSETQLDKLDGIKADASKHISTHSGLEDYLQLPDDYEQRQSQPGKKRVRWADIEERKDQIKKRELGFVVGQTDWAKITDDSYAEKALNRTKYF